MITNERDILRLILIYDFFLFLLFFDSELYKSIYYIQIYIRMFYEYINMTPWSVHEIENRWHQKYFLLYTTLRLCTIYRVFFKRYAQISPIPLNKCFKGKVAVLRGKWIRTIAIVYIIYKWFLIDKLYKFSINFGCRKSIINSKFTR